MSASQSLSHSYTTLLSTLHERTSLLSAPSATVPPSLNRTLKRQIDAFARAVGDVVGQSSSESEQLAVLKDARAKWERVQEGLERDQEGRKVLLSAKDDHEILSFPSLAAEPEPPSSKSAANRSTSNDEPYRDSPLTTPNPLDPNPQEDWRTNEALFASQSLAFADQDRQLDSLSLSIGRQRDISLRMNEELEYQSELLDDLDEGIDRTGLRLGRLVVSWTK